MNSINRHLSDAIFKSNLAKATKDMKLIAQAFDYAGDPENQAMVITGIPGPLFFAILTEHKVLYNLAMNGIDNIISTLKDSPEGMIPSAILDISMRSLESYRKAFEQCSKVTKDTIKDQYETLKGTVLP